MARVAIIGVHANVALVALAVLGEPETIATTIDFVDGDTPIGEAIVSVS